MLFIKENDQRLQTQQRKIRPPVSDISVRRSRLRDFLDSLIPRFTLLVMGMTMLLPVFAVAQEAVQSVRSPEEVIVTATLRPRTTEEIAGTVSVISAEEIERQLADDLADITRFQPGLGMETASRGGNQGFVIRGIGGNRVLTVIDGVRSSDIYAAGPSSYGKDMFEVDDLKAVEVIRGPASVLYGADAMGGAVLLRSKDPADYLRDDRSSHIGVKTSGSSTQDQVKGGLTYAVQGDTLGTVIQYTHRDFNEQIIKGAGTRNPQEGTADSWFWKSVWQASENQQLTLTADYSDEQVDTVLDNELGASVASSFGVDTSERKRVSLTHDWTLNAMLADSVRTQLHSQNTDATQFTEQLRTSFAFVNPRNRASFAGTQARRNSNLKFNQETVSGLLLLSKNFTLGSTENSSIYGITRETTDTERPRDRCDTAVATGAVSCAIPSYPMAPPEVFPNKTFPDTRTTRTGVFWQNEIAFAGERLVLIPGVRYDRYQMDPRPDALLNGSGDISEFGGFNVSEVDEREVSMNVGMLYALNEQVSLFAQYAEGFRPPNFNESNQAFVNLGHGYATVPNPDLRAESSRGNELGVRGNFNNMVVSLVAYSNRYDDFIENMFIGSVNGISLFQNANIGKSHVYGTELSADWFFAEQWQLRTAVAWSRGEDETNDTHLNSVDPLTAVVGLRYQSGDDKWALEAIATLVGKQTRVSAADRVQGNSYQLLDLIGHYRFNNFATMRFGVFNVSDTQYAQWGSIKGLAATDTTNIDNAQAPGTNVRLGINLQF
jgi:hemoglobin/transferrin/lactoferrin receptor protein